jgi:antitoxin MazE
MKTTIQKWGNSLAVKIPRVFADEIHLDESSTVDLTINSGTLVIVPAETPITTGIVGRTDHRRKSP